MKKVYTWQVEFDSGRTDYGNTKREALSQARNGEVAIRCEQEIDFRSGPPSYRIVSSRHLYVKKTKR
jgi:hypothetical protein